MNHKSGFVVSEGETQEGVNEQTAGGEFVCWFPPDGG